MHSLIASAFLILVSVSQEIGISSLHALDIDIVEKLVNVSRTPLINGSNQVETDVKFVVYTRDKMDSEINFLEPGNVELFRISSFGMNKTTKILIHGFLDSVNGLMIQDVKNSFLTTLDVNVIGVDWSAIAKSIDYTSAAKRTQNVGEYVAKLIDFLVNQGYDIKKIHIIGHSLGAHVSGSAGNAVTTGKVPRITGLDAALPGFEVITVARRLSKEDAIFVDCIHTCGGLLGIFEPFCHVDFYLNKGINPQPGCPLLDLGSCSHFRAFKYFAESVFRNHVFSTVKCNSLPCSADCEKTSVIMGNFQDPKVRGIYCGSTNSTYPYGTVLT